MITSLQKIMRERQYMDNKSGSLIGIKVTKKHSEKKNSDYYVLQLRWNMPNEETYEQELFISSEQYQLISMSEPIKPAF